MTAINRLGACSSPYLLQHAHQPVAWWPWCDEAFAEAQRRDVPVLVSIGYATCHWCHVMAHECFDDPAVAAAQNAALVCIKVDREEHPEIDRIYMDAAQALGIPGGWPLNVFCDPARRPFHAVTYLPRDAWRDLVGRLGEAWQKDRARVGEIAAALTAHLQSQTRVTVGALDETVWPLLSEQVDAAFDTAHPGVTWGETQAPKFPPHALLHLLLDEPIPGGRERAVTILEAMQDAGIHDRVGGGFHRYSVTRDWRLPHFEKMLYDQAQLVGAYARAAVLAGRPDFLVTARHVAGYLDRDLAVTVDGAFAGYAAAEDADDPGGEGAFYAWPPSDLAAALGPGPAAELARAWDVAQDQARAGASGHAAPALRHIPHPRGSGLALAPLRAGWEAQLPVLRTWRARRPRPARDGKVITEWNALALEGLCWLARATGEAADAARVRRLADMLLGRISADGHLLRLPGRAGLLPDYAAMTAGLAAAFDLLGDPVLIDAALGLLLTVEARFRAADGGYCLAPDERRDLVCRSQELHDNATPAAQAVLALGAARLAALTGDPVAQRVGVDAVAWAADIARRAPVAAATTLAAWRLLQCGPLTAVVDGAPDDPRQVALLAGARRVLDPALRIVPAADCAGCRWPCLSVVTSAGAPALHLCTSDACLPPISDPARIAAAVAGACGLPPRG